MGIFLRDFLLFFRYAAFHEKWITRMTFTCYNTKVLLLDIGKMQYRFDTYMFTINFIIQCLTLVLRLVSVLWWLNYIKYKYDEFWINVHLGKISEIHDCMFCSENSKVQFALHFAASISLIFLLNKVQVLHVSKISVTAIILLNKLIRYDQILYTLLTHSVFLNILFCIF